MKENDKSELLSTAIFFHNLFFAFFFLGPFPGVTGPEGARPGTTGKWGPKKKAKKRKEFFNLFLGLLPGPSAWAPSGAGGPESAQKQGICASGTCTGCP
jgi:hypothetical protein